MRRTLHIYLGLQVEIKVVNRGDTSIDDGTRHGVTGFTISGTRNTLVMSDNVFRAATSEWVFMMVHAPPHGM
jgi:RNase P/RNase MRP subunit p29